MNLTKILMLVLPAGAVASFAIPMFLNQQKREELTKKFTPALQKYGNVTYPSKGKDGTIKWPNKMSSVDLGDLPTIPGDMFVM